MILWIVRWIRVWEEKFHAGGGLKDLESMNDVTAGGGSNHITCVPSLTWKVMV